MEGQYKDSAGIGSNEEEEENQESQIRFRTIFEASKLGNKIISRDLKILQVNKALVELLGYRDKDEIIGTRIIDYSPKDHHRDWEIFQKELWEKSLPSFSLDTRLLKKDGSVIWCHVTSILFEDHGKTLGYTILEDVTGQHNLKLQKDEFISVASHELRTPITSLKANLQLINRILEKEADPPEKLTQLARSAELNTAKLSNLVSDLLNLTKLEQGELILNKSSFKLSELIEKCCNHIRLAGKYLIVHKGDLVLEVCADENKMDQVLVNLVNNAVKYAPESKEILIEIEKLEGKAKISVTDRGKGILPETISHLFYRFYQINKDRHHSTGLGLGLFISSEIIKKHGGEIGVESEPGKGSTFWFTIPI